MWSNVSLEWQNMAIVVESAEELINARKIFWNKASNQYSQTIIGMGQTIRTNSGKAILKYFFYFY